MTAGTSPESFLVEENSVKIGENQSTDEELLKKFGSFGELYIYVCFANY